VQNRRLFEAPAEPNEVEQEFQGDSMGYGKMDDRVTEGEALFGEGEIELAEEYF